MQDVKFRRWSHVEGRFLNDDEPACQCGGIGYDCACEHGFEPINGNMAWEDCPQCKAEWDAQPKKPYLESDNPWLK